MRDHETDVHQKLLGRAGERLTEKRYKKAGYEILARNLKTPFGEADLVAKKGDTVAFVEVKMRSSESFGAPRDAVTRAKQARYGKIALWYAQRARLENCFIRFDVAEVRDGAVSILENAFFL